MPFFDIIMATSKRKVGADMMKIEIEGNWKTLKGAIRALNKAINKATGYNGTYFDVSWKADKYGEMWEEGFNVAMNADGIYCYCYAAV